MTSEFVQSGEGDLFVQDDFSEVFEWLSCSGVGDLPLPKGDLTPVYCPDPASKGKFKIEDYVQGEPGAPTTTLTRPLSAVANWLLEQGESGCEFNMLATYGCGGTRSDPDNWDVAALGIGARVSNSRILAEAVAMSPGDNDRVMTDAEVSYIDRVTLYKIGVNAQTVGQTTGGNGIAFLPAACETRCASARRGCYEGYAALDGAIYNSLVLYTRDGGATWTETAVDPFTYSGGDASDVVVFETSDGGHKAIVSRGSATEGEPAEVAVTEDWGATWSNVDVGAVNGQYITDLFKHNAYVWAVTNDGYIYRSVNQGSSWIALEEADETTEQINAIAMYSSSVGYAVGNSNVFLYTTDGSEWNARTGPATGVNLLSVAVNRYGHVYVGAANGNLYMSEDGGQNWTLVSSFGIGTVDFIAFDDDNRYIGLLVWNDSDSVGWVYRSYDGGPSWYRAQNQSSGYNSGINAGFICGANEMNVIGEAHGGDTFIAKVSQQD